MTLSDIDRRLRELEKYLPILRQHFSGTIGPPMPSMDDLIKAKIRENAMGKSDG
jgi:hypothetical protein